MKKKFKILFLLLVVSNLVLLIYFINNLTTIRYYKQQIKLLTPRYSAKDTIQLLNEILNIKEFDWDTKLLDTSNKVIILKYPFIQNEYYISKFNKNVAYFEGSVNPGENQFLFHIFELFKNDSAYIVVEFNYSRGGIFEAKKKKGRWELIKYGIGQF